MKTFTSSHILLCKFHAIKYAKKLISTAFNCDPDEKSNILQLFKKVLYSHTLEEYELNKTELFNKTTTVQIYVQSKKVSFVEIFKKNWDLCKEMWVYCFQKYLPMMGDSTTNRMERSFWTLKRHIKDKFRTVPSIAICIMELIKYVTLRLKNTIIKTGQKVYCIMDPNPDIRELLHIASQKLTN